MSVFIVPSIQVCKFFSDHVCIGFDANKVSNDEEDLTELRDIDKSRPWNQGIKACRKFYFSEEFPEDSCREMSEFEGYREIE